MRHFALLSPAVGTGNVGDHFIELAIRRLLGEDVDYRRFSIRRTLGAAELAEIDRCECALLCGTNLYQRDWHSALTPEILARIRVPVIPFGVGSSAATLDDRELGDMTRRMALALHRACRAGSVRDPHSLGVVASAGVTNAVLTGCPVLYWAGGGTAPVFARRRRRRVILTARNWLMHRWPDNVDHPVQIRFLREVLGRLAGREVVFAVHEDYDLRLVETLGLQPEQLFSSPNAGEYVALYTDPDHVVLAMRLHAGMLAVANGVPAAFVGHDTRTYSFCEMTGLPCVELFEEGAAERSAAEVLRLLEGDVAPFAPLGPAYARLAETMREFLVASGLPGAERLAPEPVGR